MMMVKTLGALNKKHNNKIRERYETHLADILLKTAVKLLRLRANRTSEARDFNCGLSVWGFRN